MPGLLLCGFNVKSPELLKGGGDPPSEEAGSDSLDGSGTSPNIPADSVSSPRRA